jgi:regulator of protease activity HflC (stomatin/prohibitin superfamily)
VLNEAAGPYAEDIYAGIMSPDTPEDEMELLWSRLAGEGRKKIADARAYRTTVVENAKANADYLERILPEYNKRPELVLQKIYQDTMEQVLENVEEKILVQPGQGDKEREFRVIINRDPKIKNVKKNNGGQ